MDDFMAVSDGTPGCPTIQMDPEFEETLRMAGAVVWMAIMDASPWALMAVSKKSRIIPSITEGWVICRHTDEGWIMCKPKEPDKEAEQFIRDTLHGVNLLAVEEWWRNPRGMRPDIRLARHILSLQNLPPELTH